MSSFDLLMLKNELNILAGGRVQRIFQKGKRLRFEVFVSGIGARELFFEPGKLFLTMHKREASNENFSQYLRKHLSGQRILSIKQAGFERIIEIETENNILILEMFSKGNAIFCNKKKNILLPLEKQEWRHRKIFPGMPYKYPPALKNPFAIGFDGFENIIRQNEKGLAAFLATEMNLSGKYAEEVCARAGIEKSEKCKDIGESGAKKVFAAIRTLLKEFKTNIILENGKPVDFAPIEMIIYGDREKKYFSSFMEALDGFFSEAEKQTGAAAEIRFRKIMGLQKADYEKWAEKEKECMRKGETVLNNIDSAQKIIDLIKEMKERKKWEDIKNALEGRVFENLKMNEIREKEGIAVVENMEIDFRKPARENAMDYFEKAKRARRKKEAAEEALRNTENDMKAAKEREKIAEKKTIPETRKQQKYYEKFRWLFTSDSFLVIGGRDASQNETIFKRHISKNDIVLHADVHGAPLTVIKSDGKKISDEAIKEAAEFAAAYSSAWKRRLGGIDVCWINPEQVSKKAPAGASLAKGAFMIYGRKNYIKNIGLKIAIGLKIGQNKEGGKFAYPVCGTAEGIGAHAKYFVLIIPGAKPHGELAKQIMAKLIAKAPPEDKPFMEAIHADDFIRLLPAGGGDIVA